jgi:hypothetical protein
MVYGPDTSSEISGEGGGSNAHAGTYAPGAPWNCLITASARVTLVRHGHKLRQLLEPDTPAPWTYLGHFGARPAPRWQSPHGDPFRPAGRLRPLSATHSRPARRAGRIAMLECRFDKTTQHPCLHVRPGSLTILGYARVSHQHNNDEDGARRARRKTDPSRVIEMGKLSCAQRGRFTT